MSAPQPPPPDAAAEESQPPPRFEAGAAPEFDLLGPDEIQLPPPPEAGALLSLFPKEVPQLLEGWLEVLWFAGIESHPPPPLLLSGAESC